MARIKIDYGIDLGTTNSAICRMEKGEPVIKKTDVLKDTMPSCISINKKGSIKAGDGAYNTMKQDKRRATKSWRVESSNTYVEFKRTMATTTKYHSSNLGRDFTSEELSAEVLKTLKSFVTDENISSVVVTVPAKFTVNQKTATLEAAKMAGFKRCELLQEPIAAAMAYGLTAESKNGRWMVFDFGGGTFDAALLKVEDGIIQVFDTEGDNYLGGKNLDYAIVDEIIIPYLQDNYAIDGYLEDDQKKQVLRDAMKTYAEDAKNQLSFKPKEDILSNLGELGEDEDGEEIELDLAITQQEAFDVMRPLFQKAVDICKDLLKRNNLTGAQIDKLILVGGPTHSPLIRRMLEEQITPNVDTSIDPMTAVAVGAALYASTIDAEVSEEEVGLDTIRLDVQYESTTVNDTEYVTVMLPHDSAMKKVLVEFVRGNNDWSSGKVEINEQGNVIDVNLVEQRTNVFSIITYDQQGNRLPCFPEEITIIQGTKVGAAPLPYNIGIAVWSDTKNRSVFRMAKGLEKNKPLPATGVVNDLKTTNQLRPGIDSDKVVIPIYQTDDFAEAEGRTAALYEYVGDVIITGDDIDTLISEGSSVDVTLKADSSEQMTLEAHFPATDTSIEKKLDTSKKQSNDEAREFVNKQLKEAQRSLRKLQSDNIDTKSLEAELSRIKDENANSNEPKAVMQHLKELLRKIEDMDAGTEWQRLESELREEFERLEKAQQDLGNDKTSQQVEQLRRQVDAVIRQKDVRSGHEVLEQIQSLYIRLTMLYQLIGLIRHFDESFNDLSWRNPSRARQLINQGMDIINDGPTEQRLAPIIRGLFDLLPDDEKGNAGGLLK